MWDDSSVLNSTIVIHYTDRYHKDNEYWKEISFNVHVFQTEPPKFSNELQTFVIDSWTQSQQIFTLPPIIDDDSSIFDVTLSKDSPEWIQVKMTNKSSQSYYVLIIFRV